MDIPDEELWAARQALRSFLFNFIRERARTRWTHEHVSAGRIVVESANHGVPVLLIDPNGDEEVSRNLTRVAEIAAGTPRPQTATRGAAFFKGKAPLGGLAFWRGASR